jgi:hypothetical protein
MLCQDWEEGKSTPQGIREMARQMKTLEATIRPWMERSLQDRYMTAKDRLETIMEFVKNRKNPGRCLFLLFLVQELTLHSNIPWIYVYISQ